MNPDIEKINMAASYIIDNYKHLGATLSTHAADMISKNCSIPRENLGTFFLDYNKQFSLFGINIENDTGNGFRMLNYNGIMILNLSII